MFVPGSITRAWLADGRRLLVIDTRSDARWRERAKKRMWRTIVEARAAGHYVSARWPLLSLGISSVVALA